jgi:glycosyltransferase involved in cell wall biosynthesis
LAAEVEAAAGQPAEILPNVVDTERFSINPFPASGFHLGFLGALNSPVKGLDILLQALAQTPVPFFMHIGGRGPLLEQYEAQARALGVADRCRFYGFVPHAELPEFMAKLHCFVSSSRYETFGVVIAEAMAAGLPVIVTRSGGPEDYVTEENGILVPAEDAAALASAIAQMSVRYASYDRQGNAAKIRQAFSRALIRERLNAIYARVASTR